MKKLHDLAKQLKENNFEMTKGTKEQFEEYLSIIAEGSRILHPRFGLGTVTGTSGNTWVNVDFDKDNADLEKRIKDYEVTKLNNPNRWYSSPNRRIRSVQITSCMSIHMLIKRESAK
jgi:hypothetical protein